MKSKKTWLLTTPKIETKRKIKAVAYMAPLIIVSICFIQLKIESEAGPYFGIALVIAVSSALVTLFSIGTKLLFGGR